MPSTKQTIERLQQVVRVLEELPKNAMFDLAVFVDETKCGTVACAVGWAAQDTWFKRRGFNLKQFTRTSFVPVFRDMEDWDAVETFFGLDDSDSAFLFCEQFYERGSRYDVIRRIRAFCKKLEAQ